MATPLVDIQKMLETTLDDDSYYRKCFEVFLSTLSRTTVSSGKEWLSDMISTGKVLTCLRESVAHCAADGTSHTLNCMGVGAGDGDTETLMLSKLLPHFPTIYQRTLEPNETQLGLYKQLVSGKSTEFNGVTFDWRQETLEDYCKNVEKADDHTKFHFISAVHSVYHISDIEKSLGFMYRQLKHGGVLLVLMAAEESCIVQIRNMMPKMKRFHYFSIRAVCDYFNSQKIAYDTVRLSGVSDVSMCFDADTTKEASLFLDFFTNVRGFLKSPVPTDIKENALAKMESMAVGSPIGKKLVAHSEIAVVVRRQPDV